MNITIKQLKQIIKEEYRKSIREEYGEKADKSFADTVPHSWISHGKLSSALQERYGIADEDLRGEVLWHSLNESGKIGIYDMKFGDIIIRNLTEADLVENEQKEHGEEEKHGVQKPSEKKRGKKKWKSQRKIYKI